MSFFIVNRDLIHRKHIRIPMPQLGDNQELFKLTGMVHFHGDDAVDRDRNLSGPEAFDGAGDMRIVADYRHIVPEGKAILPSQWTDMVGIPNLKTTNVGGFATWAITNYSILNHKNAHENETDNVFVPNGTLDINTNVVVQGNSFIVMITYDVTIIGRIVDFTAEGPF